MSTRITPGTLAARLGYVPTALEWPADTTRPPVAMELFGRDHWSTFAYVETRTVDHNGLLGHDHMRCHTPRHPIMAGAKSVRLIDVDASRYPTQLKASAEPDADGRYPIAELPDHDDYDCLDDLVAAGLLAPKMPVADDTCGWFVSAATGKPILHPRGEGPISTDLVTGLVEKFLAVHAVWTLTERGQRVASQLRAHLAGGGNSQAFVPNA